MDLTDLVSHYGLITIVFMAVLWGVPTLLDRLTLRIVKNALTEDEKPKRKRKNDEIDTAHLEDGEIVMHEIYVIQDDREGNAKRPLV